MIESEHLKVALGDIPKLNYFLLWAVLGQRMLHGLILMDDDVCRCHRAICLSPSELSHQLNRNVSHLVSTVQLVLRHVFLLGLPNAEKIFEREFKPFENGFFELLKDYIYANLGRKDRFSEVAPRD